MAGYSKIINFIKDLYGNQEFTPLAVPKFIGNEKKYLEECIDTTFVSSVGKFVDRFEDDMARYTGCKRAVVCVSGTNALHMALMLSGVERDDEVLTQALTFIATCNALSYIGAHPVFIDVDKIEEIIPDLRIKKIHICTVIILNSRNIAPIVVQFVTVDSLQASVADEDILNQIIPVLFHALFKKFYKKSPSYHIDSA